MINGSGVRRDPDPDAQRCNPRSAEAFHRMLLRDTFGTGYVCSLHVLCDFDSTVIIKSPPFAWLFVPANCRIRRKQFDNQDIKLMEWPVF
jgi:hypothetical protein